MKYLIFGDVHGNLPALEKLFKVEQDNYDQVVCHGDVVNYGPWGNDCVELLSDIKNAVLLSGNHEDAYLAGSYPGNNKVARAFFEHCYPKFEKFGVISEFSEKYEVKEYMIQHTIKNNYFYPDSDLSDLALESNFIIGHSHYQFHREIKGKQLINTGSLGQNRRFINVADYVLLDTNKNQLELRNFTYDVKQVIDKMREEKYPAICLEYYQNKERL